MGAPFNEMYSDNGESRPGSEAMRAFFSVTGNSASVQQQTECVTQEKRA